MNLAKAVAELITSNLKNGDGSPVECVISDSTIAVSYTHLAIRIIRHIGIVGECNVQYAHNPMQVQRKHLCFLLQNSSGRTIRSQDRVLLQRKQADTP